MPTWYARCRSAAIAANCSRAASRSSAISSAIRVERDALGRHLRERGYEGLRDTVASSDQEGCFDPATFSAGLTDCLRQWHRGSPGLPAARYGEEADGIAQGLHTMAYPGVAREHPLRSGLEGLALRHETDAALTDHQGDRPGRGVLL